jgi:hypothetical protein
MNVESDLAMNPSNQTGAPMAMIPVVVQFDSHGIKRLGKDFSHPLEMTDQIENLSSRTKREILPNWTTTQ